MYVLWPTIGLTLYVNDISPEAHGSLIDIRLTVAGPTDCVVSLMQNEWAGSKKSVTAADRFSLAKAIARTSRTGKLKVARATGPFRWGRRKSTKALAVRFPAS